MRRYLMVFVVLLTSHFVNGQVRENGDFDIIMSGFGSTLEEAIRDCKLKVCSIIYYNPQGNEPYLKYIDKCDTIVTDFLEQKINKWFVVTKITMNVKNIPTCKGKRRFMAERIVREILAKTEHACCERLSYRLGDIALLPATHELISSKDEGECIKVEVLYHVSFIKRAEKLVTIVTDEIKVPDDEIKKVFETDRDKFEFYAFTDIYNDRAPAYKEKLPNMWTRPSVVVRNGEDTLHALYKNFFDVLNITRWCFKIKVGETNEVHRPHIEIFKQKTIVNHIHITLGKRDFYDDWRYNKQDSVLITGYLPVTNEGELKLTSDFRLRDEMIKKWVK